MGVSPWWLVIVALITWSLGASYFPEVVHGISSSASYALGFASALLLFASILAHEFGHALVARRHGIEVEEIDLWLLGGVSRMRGEAHSPDDEFVSGAPEGLWLALIGFFLVVASGQQALGAQVQAALSGVHAADLMSAPVVSIPAQTSVARAGTDYFLRYRYTSFPVVDALGRTVGLVSVTQLEALAARKRAGERVEDIAEHDPELIVTEDEDVARLLERPVFAKFGRAVVVNGSGSPIGLVSITDVERALRAARLTDRSPRAATAV